MAPDASTPWRRAREGDGDMKLVGVRRKRRTVERQCSDVTEGLAVSRRRFESAALPNDGREFEVTADHSVEWVIDVGSTCARASESEVSDLSRAERDAVNSFGECRACDHPLSVASA